MVLTLFPDGIDLLLTEKQSMAQIICDELAQLTWQSSPDLFAYRLTHLRDLSESWQQIDVSERGVSTGSDMPTVDDKKGVMVNVSKKPGMVTRSKTGARPSPATGRKTVKEKFQRQSKSPKMSSSKTKHAIRRSLSTASQVVVDEPVGETTQLETYIKELMENPEGDETVNDDVASNASVELSSENIQGLSPESNAHTEYGCALCESTFSVLDSLIQHVQAEHPEACTYEDAPPTDDTSNVDSTSTGDLLCKTCGLSFDNKHKLRVHRSLSGSCKTRVLGDEQLADVKCKDCEIIFANKYKLRLHRKKNGACKARGVAAVVRRREQSSAPMDGGGTCSVCERAFTRRLSLIKHLREHRLQDEAMAETVAWIRQDPGSAEEIVNTSAFHCTECECKFSSIDAVCWHLRIHTDRSHWQASKILPVQSGEYKCTVCDRQFATEMAFVVHCAENEEAHECQECGRRIQTALNLRIHRLIHRMQDKPLRNGAKRSEKQNATKKKAVVHPCPVCSRVFKHAIHLDGHMTCHTGVKNYVCHVCAKQFATKGQLKRHIMTHEGNPSFDCAHCHKRFLLRDTLQRHVRSVHEKERRHLCSLCGWPFAEKHQLVKHMSVHTHDPDLAQFIVVTQ